MGWEAGEAWLERTSTHDGNLVHAGGPAGSVNQTAAGTCSPSPGEQLTALRELIGELLLPLPGTRMP